MFFRAGSASAAFNDSDGDGVIDVAERIAGSDPNNADSGPENAAGIVYLQLPVCTDGVDNDLDGQIDDADPGCMDTDHDLVDDPAERALGSDPNNFNSVPEDSRIDAVLVSLGFITFQCNDGLDDDLDGLIDTADPGCAPFDYDGDGFGDVLEKTYGSDPNDAASQPEDDRVDAALCADRVDNDRDGLVDIEDSGCLTHPTATPTATVAPSTPPVAATPTSVVIGPVTGPVIPGVIQGLPVTGSGSDGGTGGGSALLVGLLAFGGCVLAAALALRSARNRRSS